MFQPQGIERDAYIGAVFVRSDNAYSYKAIRISSFSRNGYPICTEIPMIVWYKQPSIINRDGKRTPSFIFLGLDIHNESKVKTPTNLKLIKTFDAVMLTSPKGITWNHVSSYGETFTAIEKGWQYIK